MSAHPDSLSQRSFDDILEIVQAIGQDVVAVHADDVDTACRFPSEAFDALKDQRLLSAMVPTRLGGDGLTVRDICKICETLALHDASVAMIYAMHQIQVACLVDHGADDEFFAQFLRDLCDQQLLLASATTEVGVGGDVRSSICAVHVDGDRFELTKKAPVISYAEAADAILVTCRSAEIAMANDQSMVLVNKSDCTLEKIADWDTLGFRGTCSDGFTLTASGDARQILPVPYETILAQSMHPVSHMTWGSLWTGLAASAVEKARQTVREAARKSPSGNQISALRLAEVNEQLFSMRSGLYEAIDQYEDLRAAGNDADYHNFQFAIKTNNVKLRCSEMVIDIVNRSLMIVGINGYKNNSPLSLSRHLRDAYGAPLMVNNDRIRDHNAKMQVAVKQL